MFKFLRHGSVQAEIQLQTVSPNMSVVLQVLSSMDNLGNLSLDRNATAIRREPGDVAATIHRTGFLTNTYAIFCQKKSSHWGHDVSVSFGPTLHIPLASATRSV